ncbi:MAG: hypothetical protein QW279_04430 [Candidatus Jordarchaeaceae archaeon]
MHIPEWEVEELLKRNPALLGFAANNIELVENQKHLAKSGRYIDLLFKHGDGYLIVEIKSSIISDKSIVVDQLLEYKKNFAEETGLPAEKILCALVSPNGFTDEVKDFCHKMGIMTVTLDKGKLIDAVGQITLNLQESKRLGVDERNGGVLTKACVQPDLTKGDLANLFVEISKRAPIEAHQVGTSETGTLLTNKDKWFWLFYSVMDRRANAATFVKAKDALEKERLFAPYKIVDLLKKEGGVPALKRIARILKAANFPLLNDHVMGELAFPKSIADAAKFMSKHNYDFQHLYGYYLEQAENNPAKARDRIWKDLQTQIYGVGPRIASQIIRGLVIKGSWKLPLDDNRFLEKCRFNVWIAGPTRLGLIDREDEYYSRLGEFADKFMSGNRGIIAHVLWYVRKRYCVRPPKCDECMLAKHCKRAFSFSF